MLEGCFLPRVPSVPQLIRSITGSTAFQKLETHPSFFSLFLASCRDQAQQPLTETRPRQKKLCSGTSCSNFRQCCLCHCTHVPFGTPYRLHPLSSLEKPDSLHTQRTKAYLKSTRMHQQNSFRECHFFWSFTWRTLIDLTLSALWNFLDGLHGKPQLS